MAVKKGKITQRFKPYPAYKDSGVEWLGEIPEHWEVKRLKRMTKIQGGGTPTKDNIEYWRGDIPWVSPKDMKASLILDTEDKITLQAVRESATKLIPKGSVLIVVRSGILVHSIPVALTGREVTLNQDLKALIMTSELVPQFLMYLISGMQKELLAGWKKEGATVESLELDLIANTSIPLLTFFEQRSITVYLDRETERIDALVKKKERLIELLQEKRTALITRAVTKGLDPNAPMKDPGVEWLGEIPEHWDVKPLKAVSELQTGLTLGKTYEDGSLVTRPYLRVANVQDGYLTLDDITEVSIPSRDTPRYTLRQGDVLMTEGGDFDKLGRGYVWEGQIPDCLHQNHIFAVRPRANMLRPRFLSFILGSTYGRAYFTATSKQSTNLASTNSTKLKNLPLPVPRLEEQDTILTMIDQGTAIIDALISKVREAVEKLKEYRIALISAAVTGKIDLRGEKM